MAPPSPTGAAPPSCFSSKLHAFLMEREQQKPLEEGFVRCPLHAGHHIPLAALVTHLTDLHMGDDLSLAEGAMYSSSTATRRMQHVEGDLYAGLLTSIENAQEASHDTKRVRGVRIATEERRREHLCSPRHSSYSRSESARDSSRDSSAVRDEEDLRCGTPSASSSSFSISSSSTSSIDERHTRIRKRRRSPSHKRCASSQGVTHRREKVEPHRVGKACAARGTGEDGIGSEEKGEVSPCRRLPPILPSVGVSPNPALMPVGREWEWEGTGGHSAWGTEGTRQWPPPPQYPSEPMRGAGGGPLLFPFSSDGHSHPSAWGPTAAVLPSPVWTPSPPFWPLPVWSMGHWSGVDAHMPSFSAQGPLTPAGGGSRTDWGREVVYPVAPRGPPALETSEWCFPTDAVEQVGMRRRQGVAPWAAEHLPAPLRSIASLSPSLGKDAPPLVLPHAPSPFTASVLSRSIVLQLREEHLHEAPSGGVAPVLSSFRRHTPSPTGATAASPQADGGRVDPPMDTSREMRAKEQHTVCESPRESEADEALHHRGENTKDPAEGEKNTPSPPLSNEKEGASASPPALARHALLDTLLLSLRPILDLSRPLPSPSFLSTDIASTPPVPSSLSLQSECRPTRSSEMKEQEEERQPKSSLSLPDTPPDGKEVAEGDLDPLLSSSNAAPSMLEDVMILGSRIIWLYKDDVSRKEALRRLISPSGRHFLQHYLKFVS